MSTPDERLSEDLSRVSSELAEMIAEAKDRAMAGLLASYAEETGRVLTPDSAKFTIETRFDGTDFLQRIRLWERLGGRCLGECELTYRMKK